MSDGIKPTRIEREGYALPDEVSIDGAYTGDDVDWDSSPGMLGFDQWKQPVRAATTAAITIATALNNGDTLDGVTLATGDRVLVKDQGASAEQNGIYIVGATPVRSDDLDEDAEVLGSVVYVIDGTANAGTVWTCTNVAATVVDTDDIDWAQLSGGSGGGVTVADEGTPLSTTATTLDFVGAGVTATGSGATKTITIPGGSGIVVKDEGSTLTTDATTLDFVGAGVVASGTGATKTITIAGASGSFTHAYIGYNTVGGSTETVTNRRQYMKKVTIASACLLTSVAAYVKQTSAGTVISISAGVLTDNSGSPELLIAHYASDSSDSMFLSTSNGSAGAARWIDCPVSLYLPAGDYWLAFQLASNTTNNHQVYYDGSGGDRYFTNNNDTRLSDAGWTTVTTSSNKYSIRASTIS